MTFTKSYVIQWQILACKARLSIFVVSVLHCETVILKANIFFFLFFFKSFSSFQLAFSLFYNTVKLPFQYEGT